MKRRRSVDVEDRLRDLITIYDAANPEELWRALLASPVAAGGHPFEAVGLFRRHHEQGGPDAVVTALLLCTDRRWDAYTARLVAGLVETGILDEADLAELVACFLWSDAYRVMAPIGWLGTRLAVADPGLAGQAPRVVEVDPVTPVPVERTIAPPLRRWAAATALRRDPGQFASVVERALGLEPRGGAAVMAGVLDAVEVLGADDARASIAMGLAWPRGSVRIQALDLVAEVDPEAAAQRATGDPDAKVRAWAVRRDATRRRLPSPDGGRRSEQGTLFPDG